MTQVPLEDGRLDPERLLGAVTERTRLVLICNPNDPTGAYLPAEQLGELLSRLPEHVHVLLDESYIQFQDVEDEDACLKLTEAFPRLLVFRTFSRAYGLSGLRAGLRRRLAGRRGPAGRASRRCSGSTRSRRRPCCRRCAPAAATSSAAARP